jgi:hypothetical protein
VHLGLILPNFGEGSTPEGIRRMAEAAEELGVDSVWATEHIIVGPEAVNPYGRVYDPLVVLAWVAGFTQRIGLGTSIVLVPLHAVAWSGNSVSIRGTPGDRDPTFLRVALRSFPGEPTRRIRGLNKPLGSRRSFR